MESALTMMTGIIGLAMVVVLGFLVRWILRIADKTFNNGNEYLKKVLEQQKNPVENYSMLEEALNTAIKKLEDRARKRPENRSSQQLRLEDLTDQEVETLLAHGKVTKEVSNERSIDGTIPG